LGSASYELTIQIKGDKAFKNMENESNKPIFDNLRDCLKIATLRHLPSIQHWIDIISKYNTEDKLEASIRDDMLTRCLDLNNTLNDYQRKCYELNINSGNIVRGKDIIYDDDGNELVLL
jgi:hypothetical protein